MFKADEVRRAFPDGVFKSPASLDAIAAAESLLGHALPAQLRDLYLNFDGFLGPTNAPFLHPLLERPGPGGESLVTFTLFFRGERYFPEWLQHAVAIGDDGTGTGWFILLNEAEKLVIWDAEWEDYEPVEGNLLDDWVKAKNLYASS